MTLFIHVLFHPFIMVTAAFTGLSIQMTSLKSLYISINFKMLISFELHVTVYLHKISHCDIYNHAVQWVEKFFYHHFIHNCKYPPFLIRSFRTSRLAALGIFERNVEKVVKRKGPSHFLMFEIALSVLVRLASCYCSWTLHFLVKSYNWMGYKFDSDNWNPLFLATSYIVPYSSDWIFEPNWTFVSQCDKRSDSFDL